MIYEGKMDLLANLKVSFRQEGNSEMEIEMTIFTNCYHTSHLFEIAPGLLVKVTDRWCW